MPAESSCFTMGWPLLAESHRVEQKARLFQLIQAPSSQRTQNESCLGLGSMPVPAWISAHMRMVAGAAFLFVKNPEWHPGFDVDKPLAVQTRRKLYDMAIADNMPIQAFHAAFPGLVRVEKDGSGYRWVSVMYIDRWLER